MSIKSDTTVGRASIYSYAWLGDHEEEEELGEAEAVAEAEDEAAVEEAAAEEVKKVTLEATEGTEEKLKKVTVQVSESGVSEAAVTSEEEEEEELPIRGRRKTIYELDSYLALLKIEQERMHEEEDEESYRDIPAPTYTSEIPGMAQLTLSPLTQKIVGCAIDENLTTEYPWVHVRKDIIMDNLDLHPKSSDFLPLKKEIERYPGDYILVGYAALPELEDDFYLCLTREAREAVVRRLEFQRQAQRERVSKAIKKKPKAWSDLGSGPDVDVTIVKKTRPLYEIEVESTVSMLKAPLHLVDRKSDEQRDGYVEVVPYREKFQNVERVLVDKASKAIPMLRDGGSQTITAMNINSLCQCILDRESGTDDGPVNPLELHTGPRKLQRFLRTRVDEIVDQIVGNTTWDVYANDFAKLVEDRSVVAAAAAATIEPAANYTERQNYYDGKLCGGRVINDLSWHPQWTGVAAAAYTSASKCENHVGRKPRNEMFKTLYQVLIWSFDDCLKPKLILECKREVTSVSFCPRNGNIIVGGCNNGQVVVWDITGKIEEVETVVVQTAAQVKHKTIMKNLTSWMKESRGSSIIPPTITSSLQYSQIGPISKVDWFSPYISINTRGRVESLDDDTEEDELSMQFATTSEDGSIAFWELRPPVDKDARAKRRKLERPQSLIQSISPYKVLDGTFKPVYMVVVEYFDARTAVITALSLRRPNLRTEQVDPFPHTDDVTERNYYKVIVEKLPEKSPIDGIFIGTAKGECGTITWEGFEFSTGLALNKETCKWIWKKQVHDGPITHIARSQYVEDTLLTVGGRIFAVWHQDREDPLFWRKSECRYTACSWDSNKPSVIILGRNDGTVEIWDISIKWHEPNKTQSLSGRVITGIFAHDLPLRRQCVGFCDYNGALRVFLAPAGSSSCREADIEWMRTFVEREVARINEYNEWRKNWFEKNAETKKKEPEEGEQQEAADTGDKSKQEATRQNAKIVAARKAKARKRDQLVERMRARWVTRELHRMSRAILTKKGLREEELERRRKPVLKMQKEAREKEKRRQRIMEAADDMFEEAVVSNFPRQSEKLLQAAKEPEAPMPIPQPMTDSAEELQPPTERLVIPPEATVIGDHVTPDDSIIQDFEDLESQAVSSIRRRSGLETFSWRALIIEGIRRRKSMDVKLRMHHVERVRSMRSITNASIIVTDETSSPTADTEVPTTDVTFAPATSGLDDATSSDAPAAPDGPTANAGSGDTAQPQP